MTNPTTKVRSRWGRFSLRLLLLSITLVAIVFAAWSSLVEPYRRQAAASQRMSDLHGVDPNAQMMMFPGRPVSAHIIANQPQNAEWHQWLVESTLGEGAFVKIVTANFPAETKIEDVRFVLSRMPFLETVHLNKTVVDVQVAQLLASLPDLRLVEAKHSNISDEVLAGISDSKSIQRLVLTSNPITDESVESLAAMKSLDELFLRWTKMSQAAVDSLNEKLPDCTILFYQRAEKSNVADG